MIKRAMQSSGMKAKEMTGSVKALYHAEEEGKTMDFDTPRLPAVITGTVIEGKKIGRRLGFPTANLRMPENGARLPYGVYAAAVTLRDGRRIPGILNHGRHPTLPEGSPTVEVHLFDFDENLYGQTVQVEYLFFLRPEARFHTKEAMQAQVLRDIAETRKYFGLTLQKAP